MAQFWDHVGEPTATGCREWSGSVSVDGYGLVGGRRYKAHRVAWELAVGAIPDGLWVLHRCDNPPCVNPAHLFLGTAKDNHFDMVTKGRAVYYDRSGEKNPAAKLTDEQRAVIVARYVAGGITQAQLAEIFGVTQVQVSHITRAARGAQRGRRYAERTHCPQGHAYDEENTLRYGKGGRTCRTCKNEQARRSYAARRRNPVVPAR